MYLPFRAYKKNILVYKIQVDTLVILEYAVLIFFMNRMFITDKKTMLINIQTRTSTAFVCLLSMVLDGEEKKNNLSLCISHLEF